MYNNLKETTTTKRNCKSKTIRKYKIRCGKSKNISNYNKKWLNTPRNVKNKESHIKF